MIIEKVDIGPVSNARFGIAQTAVRLKKWICGREKPFLPRHGKFWMPNGIENQRSHLPVILYDCFIENARPPCRQRSYHPIEGISSSGKMITALSLTYIMFTP
jgi:hypothetical protein